MKNNKIILIVLTCLVSFFHDAGARSAEDRALRAKQREERRLLRQKHRVQRRQERVVRREKQREERQKKRTEALEDIKSFIKDIVSKDKKFNGEASLLITSQGKTVQYSNKKGIVNLQGSRDDVYKLVAEMVDADTNFEGKGSVVITVARNGFGKNINYDNEYGFVRIDYFTSDESGDYSLRSEDKGTGRSITSVDFSIKSLWKKCVNWLKNLFE